jgi:hypothetical protein
MSVGFIHTQERLPLPEKDAQKPPDDAARRHRADIPREADCVEIAGKDHSLRQAAAVAAERVAVREGERCGG